MTRFLRSAVLVSSPLLELALAKTASAADVQRHFDRY
jgi:hypothetical protein